MRWPKHVSLSLLAISVSMAALVGCDQGGSTVGQPTTPRTTASTSPSGASTSSPTTLVLGPNGYGALKLGMTVPEAAATGLTTGTKAGPEGLCGGDGGFLKGSPPAAASRDMAGRLFFSASTGKLIAINAFGDVKTPEGIGLGSTYDRVHAAYPDWKPVANENSVTEGHGWAKVPGNTDAHYRIAVHNLSVIELSLDDNNQDCYE